MRDVLLVETEMKVVNEKHLTPWFDGKKYKPARQGVYMLMDGSGKIVGYQRWDGRQWYSWSPYAEDAAKKNSEAASYYQNDDWRGLRREPK